MSFKTNQLAVLAVLSASVTVAVAPSAQAAITSHPTLTNGLLSGWPAVLLGVLVLHLCARLGLVRKIQKLDKGLRKFVLYAPAFLFLALTVAIIPLMHLQYGSLLARLVANVALFLAPFISVARQLMVAESNREEEK